MMKMYGTVYRLVGLQLYFYFYSCDSSIVWGTILLSLIIIFLHPSRSLALLNSSPSRVFTSHFYVRLYSHINHRRRFKPVLAVFSIFTANRIIYIYSAVLKLRRIIGTVDFSYLRVFLTRELITVIVVHIPF